MVEIGYRVAISGQGSTMYSVHCNDCRQAFAVSATFFSGGSTYFGLLPRDEIRFSRNCRFKDRQLVERIHGCPSARLAVEHLILSRSTDNRTEGRTAEKEPSGDSVPSLQAVMGRFLSLGDNCEFGLVQRWTKAEPVDLLRFAAIYKPAEHRLNHLVGALETGFEGLGDEGTIVCTAEGNHAPREYIVRESRWNLLYHTNRHEGAVDEEKLVEQQSASLQMRRRKLFGDLRTANRVLVWKSNFDITEAEVRRLLNSARELGPNLLLWVQPAGSDGVVGMVEYAGDGLLIGYVEKFAPYSAAYKIDFPPWEAVCRNAYAASAVLARAGEWSRAASSSAIRSASVTDDTPTFISISDAADTIVWEERRSAIPVSGTVSVNMAFRDQRQGVLFSRNPGTAGIRSAWLSDITLDTDLALLRKDDLILSESRYMVTEEEYSRPQRLLRGMRFIGADRTAVIGYQRHHRHYHRWMTEALPAICLGVEHVGRDRALLILPPLTRWQAESLELLNLGDVPRVVVDVGHHYHFERAFFSEYLSGRAAAFISPRVQAALDVLAAGVESPVSGTAKRLYVAYTGPRDGGLSNEPEVQALMVRHGFAVVVLNGVPLAQQVAMFREAEVVIGPHSPGMSNLAFSRPGTRVLELFSSDRVNPCVKLIAQNRGIKYHAEIFAGVPDKYGKHREWSVDMHSLEEKIGILV